METASVQGAKCPDCGRAFTAFELDVIGNLFDRPAESVARVIAGNGCRAAGQDCGNASDRDAASWDRDTVADIATIMVGVDTVDGFAFDEESAFGLFD